MNDSRVLMVSGVRTVSIDGHAVRVPSLWASLAASAWSGLVAGFAELASFQVRVETLQYGLLRRSPAIYWMIPFSNLVLFLLLGLGLGALGRWIPRWAGPVLAVSLSAMGFLAFFLSLPGLKAAAALMLAIGLASWIGPALLARSARFAEVVTWTLPVMLAGLIGLAGLVSWSHGARLARLDPGAPRPSAGSPNVLFLVMDTVRYESTSLGGGQGRRTTPFLESLAKRGTLFSQAIAPASWTLPSHASMFTSRWPWELGVGPDRPLGDRYPTLASWMTSRGYRTAGIVANTVFCSEEYGLSQGFQHYEDHVFTPREIMRASSIGWLLNSRLDWLRVWIGSSLGFDVRLAQTRELHRKTAPEVNEAALRWIEESQDRPFFLFLNYFDVHDPYILPQDQPWRFGSPPSSLTDWRMLRDWAAPSTQARSPRDVRLARDTYENCLAYLDSQLARLFSRLEERGILKDTVVVVAADHGEEFGENTHDGRTLYGHGEWVYQPAVHVPLLVLAPGRIPEGARVDEAVSLRDLPRTILDLTGQDPKSPFLGASLAPLARGEPGVAHSPAFSEFDPLRDLSHEERALDSSQRAMQAIIAEDHAYLHSADGRDALYDLKVDPREQSALPLDPATKPVLDRMRVRLQSVAPVLLEEGSETASRQSE